MRQPSLGAEAAGLHASCFDVETSSRAIGFEVRRRVNKGAPLYYIDAELITRVDPNLLIAQEHCDVCAATPGDIAGSGCEELARQVPAFRAGSVGGICDDIRRIGCAINRKAVAEILVAKMRQS